MEESVDLKSAMERIAISCAEVRTYRNHFNEGQWQDDLDRLLALVEEIQGQHALAIEDSLLSDYANLSGCARQIFIPLTSPTDTEGRFMKLRGAMGNLKSDIDLALDFASEIYPDSEFSTISSTSNVVHKEMYNNELQKIEKQLSEIKSFINNNIKNDIEKLDLPADMKIQSDNIYLDLRKNINKISISVSIGEGLDLAVVERATIAFAKLVKNSIEYFSKISSKISENLKSSLFELKLKTQLLIRETMLFKKAISKNDHDDPLINLNELKDTENNEKAGLSSEYDAKQFGVFIQNARISCKELNYLDYCTSVDEVTIYDISRSTRIPARYIENIESGNLNLLPSDVYVIGYVKSISRLLGLDEFEVSSKMRKILFYRRVT